MVEVRFAQFNASLNRPEPGTLVNNLSTPDNAQAQAVAEIIQRTNPDVLLINEFDFDAQGQAAALFQENYLSVSQNGADPVEYPYIYLAPSNTGIASGFDLDNNGEVVTTPGEPGYGNDALGFGNFPGQFAMVLYSKYPIVEEQVRTFQTFLWQDMPGALLPDDPATPEPNDWYSEEELANFRLSSKSHWDVPIAVNGEVIHVLASHPTPPVFDDPPQFPEGVDFNGRRNHDEIRFWSDYVTSGAGDYIYDDAGNVGGLPEGASFVIMGDQNADPFDGDSFDNAILQLLDNPRVNTAVTPSSAGGPDAAVRQGQLNDEHLGNPALDTADFNDSAPGNLRVDYVLPSQDLAIDEAGVFWPPDEDPLFDLVGNFDPDVPPTGFPSSDHRLVFADVEAAAIAPNQSRRTVESLEFLGEVTFATGFQFQDTEFGGLSGITYDPSNGVYYTLSDDRSQIDPARFYTLDIDISDASLDEGDITFNDVTTLLNENGEPYPATSIDPEGIAYTSIGTVFISSEGDANNLINPFVNEFSIATGELINQLPVPDQYLPSEDQSSGIRNNLAFESLTVTPSDRFLYTATENALNQDGPAAGVDTESPTRILRYDLTTDEPGQEFLYFTDPVQAVPDPADEFSTNGLVELLALDNTGTLLALERSFSVGVGNTIRLYEVRLQGATDISDFDGILNPETGEPFDVDEVAQKRLLLDFADLGIPLDNIEGITFGPDLPDGRQSLILVSDNNFNDTQFTQFLSFAVDLDTIPAVEPVVETPPLLRFDPEDPQEEVFDSDDPAIYVHPTDPGESFVITALKNGGFGVYDLEGEELQLVTPENIRYNNVDLVYGFELNGESVDLAVFSDRRNDTLAIYQIDPETGQLTNVTSANIPETIFGVDDGEQTAYGLATYTSPVSGRSYAFVSQSDSNQIAQLELTADNGTVNANIVRTIEVPIPEGTDLEDALVEGMVVDRELGYLYVGQEAFGIYRYFAEPDAGNESSIVDTVENGNLEADVEGLTIYYGADGGGYLIASSQGDSTFALYERAGFNQFLGSFAVGDSDGIDGAEESDGADITSVPLGDEFPSGLLVVHDGSNEPAAVFQDPEDGEIQNFNTNFKYVPFEAVAATSEVVEVEPGNFDPRNPTPNSLVNGIASGDTTQDSTVLWARSTIAGEVTFEYSTDPEFDTLVGTQTATVTDPDVPVKVQIDGLDAGTQYFYRVTDAAGATATAQFKTAQELGTRDGFRFGATGDWQQAAPYPSLVNVPERDLDLFVKLGDTIYADLETPALPGVSQARSLSEFRTKHAEILSQRFDLNTVPEIYASTSILATIDDHEIVDNFAGGAAPGESPDAPDIGSSDEPLFTDDVEFVNDTQVYEDALQAYQEYHPLENRFYDTPDDPRTDGERQLYRYNTYGSDAAVMVLDSRSFRDAQIDPVDLNDPDDVNRFLAEAYDPTRTLLGQAQLDRVKNDLLNAQENDVTWKFVVIPEPIQNFGLVNAEDRFEGYAAERTELLQFIDDNNIENVVFMAGDFHGTIVNNLTYQTQPGGEVIPLDAFEVVTGPVAFFDGLFGPTVANLGAAAGLIPPEQLEFYNSLPVDADPDSEVDDRDDFIKQFLNEQIQPFGFDPFGLNDNLESAEGLIDAQLLQGDYVATHTFGWTEFDIAADSGQLTVTTYGIDAYSEEDLLANPEAITNLEPRIVSQFTVDPAGVEAAQPRAALAFGTPASETLEGGIDFSDRAYLFAGANDDLVDASTGTPGGNRIYGGSGNDELLAGTGDRVFGGAGDDVLDASAVGGGNNRLYAGAGNDDLLMGSGDRAIAGEGDDRLFITSGGNNLLTGGAGADQFWIANAEVPESANTITDYTLEEDVIGIAGLDASFAGLNLTQEGDDTRIALSGSDLAILLGVEADSLSAENFAFA